MRIISWNVNGLRAASKKGFLEWLIKDDSDIVCLQEIRAYKEQLSHNLVNPKNYYSYFNPAVKKGYSGTAVYTKKKPLSIKTNLITKKFSKEGRILWLEYSDFILINFYLPHGGRQKEKLDYKIESYHHILNLLKKTKNKNVILVGDFNIAHQEIDLARPKNNQDNIMFTLEERKQIDRIIKLGFIDTFRKFHQTEGGYTWWAYIANARERNLGWRIDYIFISKDLILKVKDAFVLQNVFGSDHCPVGIEIKI